MACFFVDILAEKGCFDREVVGRMGFDQAGAPLVDALELGCVVLDLGQVEGPHLEKLDPVARPCPDDPVPHDGGAWVDAEDDGRFVAHVCKLRPSRSKSGEWVMRFSTGT